MTENTHQETDYDGYNSYPLKNIVNSNLDIFLIHNMATGKVNITKTKKKYFQIKLSYIFY